MKINELLWFFFHPAVFGSKCIPGLSNLFGYLGLTLAKEPGPHGIPVNLALENACMNGAQLPVTGGLG